MIAFASEDLCYQRAKHALDSSVSGKSPGVIRRLALAIAIVGLAASPVLAHGGGLDSQGCHTNSKTGDRHCHRSGGNNSQKSSGLVSGPVNLLSVGDGDTVRVIDKLGAKVTIRLACIDAPETSQGSSGKWSTKTLKGMVRINIDFNLQLSHSTGAMILFSMKKIFMLLIQAIAESYDLLPFPKKVIPLPIV